MVKIRLKRIGKKKAPFYHIVVADSRRARDGKIIEQIGTYDPMTTPSTVVLEEEKYEKWLTVGAKPTDTVKQLFEIAKGNVKFVEKKPKKEEPKTEEKEAVEETVAEEEVKTEEPKEEK